MILCGTVRFTPRNFFCVQQLERAWQVVGVDLEAEVAPIGEARVVAREDGEGGVVHRRADRVLDRVTEHGEGGAGARPGLEVAESERVVQITICAL